jgi:hypothetical protein
MKSILHLLITNLNPIIMKSIFTFILTTLGVFMYSYEAADAQAQLPDLRTVVPDHLQIQNTGQQEYLRFSNGIANTGHGDLRLRPEFPLGDINQPQLAIQELLDANRNLVSSQVVSEFEYHPAHHHWHINDIALFAVHAGSPTGAVYGTTSIKVTFCLIDWYKMDDNSPTGERIYWDCLGAYQGIQPGWVDQYHQATEGQEVNITGAPAGVYYLVSTANPDHNLLEEDYSNNTAWVSFMLSRSNNGNPKINITGHSACATPALCAEGIPNR